MPRTADVAASLYHGEECGDEDEGGHGLHPESEQRAIRGVDGQRGGLRCAPEQGLQDAGGRAGASELGQPVERQPHGGKGAPECAGEGGAGVEVRAGRAAQHVDEEHQRQTRRESRTHRVHCHRTHSARTEQRASQSQQVRRGQWLLPGRVRGLPVPVPTDAKPIMNTSTVVPRYSTQSHHRTSRAREDTGDEADDRGSGGRGRRWGVAWVNAVADPPPGGCRTS